MSGLAVGDLRALTGPDGVALAPPSISFSAVYAPWVFTP